MKRHNLLFKDTHVNELKTYRIVVMPGDGIGPEIIDAALDVLDTVQEAAGGFSLACEFHKAGAACYRDTGQAITPPTLCRLIPCGDAGEII